jgi:RNA polymerase sigma-70 factor (ECF subfamily)
VGRIHCPPARARTLIERLYPLVISIVRAHRSRRLAEEDLAQEVFIKMLSNLSQYEVREGVPFEHWVSRLAVRVCLDALRSEQRRPELRLADLSEAEAAWVQYFNASETDPPDTTPAEARETVEMLLAQLPPKDRVIISLLDLEQRSVKAISELTA